MEDKIKILSDYQDFYIVSREEAENQLENAEEFIRMIELYLKKSIL